MAIKTADDGKSVSRRRKAEETNIRVAVDSATVIKVGDNLWLDTDDAKPCADTAWDTDEATTRGNFTAKYLGVAMSASKAGETKDVVVAPKGVFEFDLKAAPGANLEIGTLMGPAKAAGNALLNQVLHNAATAKGIGKLVQICKTTDTTALVEIRSAYVPAPAS